MRYITPEQIMRERFAGDRKPQWSTAILCFRDHSGSSVLIRELDAKPLGYKVIWGMQEFPGAPIAHQFTLLGEQVGVIARCEWGGPQTAIIVEELAYLGVKHLVGLGMAGSIDRTLPKASIVLASPALVTDGTSRCYTDEMQVFADSKLQSAAVLAARSLGLPLELATVATVDAIYRETNDAVASWRKAGAQILTMETAPFYAASAKCGVKSVWLGHVSDCLLGNQWEAWDSKVEETAPSVVKIAVEGLKAISGS